jgi:orotidine-5'-phosphate decarboxylase
MKFIDKLLSASRKNKSLLCVGLDPDRKLMPDVDLLEFNKAIIGATADLVCAYKPNFAFYEAMGMEGLNALKETIAYIPGDILIIGDAKRGDIGNTAKAYAEALFT